MHTIQLNTIPAPPEQETCGGKGYSPVNGAGYTTNKGPTMTRALLSILTILVLSTSAYAENPTFSPETLPEVITFQGIEMRKAFQDAKDGTFIVEYLPEGETLDNWVSMFAVRREAVDALPVEKAKGVAIHLKKINPQFRSQVVVNKTTGVAGIDFLVWPENDAYGEFNSWKYMQGEPGWLYSFQFGRRGYTDTKSWDELVAFMKRKNEAVNEMMKFEIKSE